MGRSIFNVIMVIIAVIFAILTIFATPQHPRFLAQVQTMYHFFDVMLPVLAFAALINYLWKSSSCPKAGSKNDGDLS